MGSVPGEGKFDANKKGPPFGEPLSLNLGAAPGVEYSCNTLFYMAFLWAFIISTSKAILLSVVALILPLIILVVDLKCFKVSAC